MPVGLVKDAKRFGEWEGEVVLRARVPLHEHVIGNGAEIDCRLLPDQDHDEFIALLQSVINDPGIRIEKIMGFSPAVSTTDTDLYRAIERVMKKHYPGSPVIPSVLTAFTDSHFFRDPGIVCYGFDPTVVPVELEGKPRST